MPAQGELRGPKVRHGGGDWDSHGSDIEKPLPHPGERTPEELAKARARATARGHVDHRPTLIPLYAVCGDCHQPVYRYSELADGYWTIQPWQHRLYPLTGPEHPVTRIYFEGDQ